MHTQTHGDENESSNDGRVVTLIEVRSEETQTTTTPAKTCKQNISMAIIAWNVTVVTSIGFEIGDLALNDFPFWFWWEWERNWNREKGGEWVCVHFQRTFYYFANRIANRWKGECFLLHRWQNDWNVKFCDEANWEKAKEAQNSQMGKKRINNEENHERARDQPIYGNGIDRWGWRDREWNMPKTETENG